MKGESAMNEEDRGRIDKSNHDLVRGWVPAGVFRFFADLSAIPRGSGNVAAVADFLEAFARARNLESARDAVGNVIVRKSAQHASADRKGVILQAHQDMVCVKVAEIDHDFALDPVEFELYDGWLSAKGTTLGADDGIGVALALAALDDPDMSHPPLEALFTVDEETDMKGARAVKPESLRGETLINLDAEELHTVYISSAAGVNALLELPLAAAADAHRYAVYRAVRVEGLLGGHSGIEINKARANAYVLLARFLAAASGAVDFALYTFERGEGHGADNAIPDRALAVVGLTSEEEARKLEKLSVEWAKIFQNEYRASDAGANLRVEPAERPGAATPALDAGSRDALLRVVRLLPLGVFRFVQTKDLMGEISYRDLLVETSCNMGIAKIENGLACLTLLSRGSTLSALEDLSNRIEDLARLAGGSVKTLGRSAAWEMSAEPTPVQGAFERLGLKGLGVHAGLECGFFVEAFGGAGRKLDAVSVGPDILDAHSPRERLRVDSVGVLWGQLTKVLAEMAE